MKSKSSFKHESLLEGQDVADVLKAIAQAISEGSLSFSDDKGTLQLNTEGLLQLRVKASDEEGRQQVDIRCRWERQPKQLEDKPPVVG